MTADLDPPGVSRDFSHDGAELIKFDTARFSAMLSLSGGQLLAYRAHGAQPLLYLSPLATIAPKQAIRGGIPLCWPWFGEHPSQVSAPRHGVLRTKVWRDVQIIAREDGFTISLSGARHGMLACDLRYGLTAEGIEIELTSRNLGGAPEALSTAIHSYLAVSELMDIRLRGLAGTRYYDKTKAQFARHSDETLPLGQEFDRIVCTDLPLDLIDPGWSRCISVQPQGSASCVLWNPGPDRTKSLPDLPDEDWRRFICIETANVQEDRRLLTPGRAHTLRTRLRAMPL